MTATSLLDDPVYHLLAVVSVLLVFKMMLVGTWTSVIRIRRSVYATPEDYAFRGLAAGAGVDADVERTRRAHRNDLENVLPFLAVAPFYAMTAPSLTGARILFWGFFIGRALHSIFYIRGRQPHRTIAFGVAQVLFVVMLVLTLIRLA
jgi:glutathione S-transferase